MMKPRPFARIAITLPEQDLAAADRLARALDRSRSWIVAEAVRRYVDALEAPAAHALLEVDAVQPGEHAVVNRDVPPRSRPGMGLSRLAQLSRDLALTLIEATVDNAECPHTFKGVRAFSCLRFMRCVLRALSSLGFGFASEHDVLGRSLEQRPIATLVLSTSKPGAGISHPRVMLVASQHGAAEPAGGEAMLRLARQLLDGDLRKLVQSRGRLVPLLLDPRSTSSLFRLPQFAALLDTERELGVYRVHKGVMRGAPPAH